MADDAWRDYRGYKGYTVYKTGNWGFPYTVSHNGRVLCVCATRWGARRAIASHRAREQKPSFWERPVVHREGP